MTDDLVIELESTYSVRCGHHLTQHPKCSNFHGELFIVKVGIEKEKKYITSDTFIADFGDIRRLLNLFFEPYDHKFLTCDKKTFLAMNELKKDSAILLPYEPSCENLAIRWFEALSKILQDKDNNVGLRLNYMKVYESEYSKGVSIRRKQ